MKILAALGLAALATTAPAAAACAAPETAGIAAPAEDARPALDQYNLGDGGLALEGRDPVSYFAAGAKKPAKGKKDLTATHRGVTYRFANEANRKAFLAKPAAYEPAYGGWCAYAMADGQKVEVDVDSFLIEDGRLMVFYKGLFNDTRKKWLKAGDLEPKADAGWKKISGEKPPVPPTPNGEARAASPAPARLIG